MAAALAAVMTFAQGPRGPKTGNPANRPTPVVDMARVRTIAGAVSAINIGYGTQYPSVTIGEAVIKVAPVWFLLENDFEIRPGSTLSVVAANSTLPNDSYLYAIEITNTATQARIVLRDSSGVPQWSGGKERRGGGRGNPDSPRAGAGCVDPTTIVAVAGIVEKVSMGAGIEMPTLIVKGADGALVTIKIGPERILLEADFELKEGEYVTAKYAKATCTDENVALQLTNAAGETTILRSDAGAPNWD
jgi:hypothetical protein